MEPPTVSQPQYPQPTGPRPPQGGQGAQTSYPPIPSSASPVPPAAPRPRERAARHGAITAGLWLIALGLVFLARDWGGWSWAQAWPLFVIAAGGVTLVSRLLHRADLDAGSWSLAWPIAWVVIGVVVLAATTGNLSVGLGDVLSRWWPVAFILVGVWFLVASVWPGRRRAVEELALPIGPSPAASVQLRFGGGVLEVGRAGPGVLLAGRFQGGVRYRTHGPDAVELEPDTGRGWPMSGATFQWSLGLTGEKPLDLRLDTGASRATIDLADLLVRQLELHSGAAETRLRLPRAAGATLVRTDTGVSSLLIEIPPGVGARIRSTMAMGRVDVDPARFTRYAEGWQSPDYPTAANRVDLDVRGGVGSVTIR